MQELEGARRERGRQVSYDEWIAAYAKRMNGLVMGRCADATKAMVEAFPELRRVPGHVDVLGWGRRAHWWCVTPAGEIVDPTESQFPCVESYEPFVPGTVVRVGRCMNCGEDIEREVYDLTTAPMHETFCSSSCAEDMARAMS
jgi:hypothetical protein